MVVLLELTTNQKGLIAETAIMHEAAKLGIGVARPLDDERYDLILDLGDRTASRPVQVGRSARRRRRRAVSNVPSRPERTHPPRLHDRRDRRDRGVLRRARHVLPAADGDVCRPSDRSSCGLRRRGTTSAAGSTGLRTTSSALHLAAPGPIAQLGERLAWQPKAVGSSPTGSTFERAQALCIIALKVPHRRLADAEL